MGWRKKLGLAGLAGVAATGVLVVRAERRRRAYTPQEVRQHLHARLAEGSEAVTAAPPPPGRTAGVSPERPWALIEARARSWWRTLRP
jgi:hypothetical protein